MKSLLTALLLMLLHGISVAQDNYSAQLVKVLPQSPNAATLLSFLDAPVGYYTGIPSTSIPIYTATSGKLSVPISLSYHGGGVKVEDPASWVGLNWDLSAGGSIIRNKRGVIDEDGYSAGVGAVSSFASMTHEDQYSYFLDAKSGLVETAPDIFSFSMPGESGKFFYDEQGHIVTKPRTRMDIAYGNYFSRNGWKIVNMEGQQFYFLEPEESVSNVTSLPASPGSGATQISAWHLSKIISPEGRDTIGFEYDEEIHSFFTGLAATRYFPLPPTEKVIKDEFLQSWNSVTAKLLKKISFNNGTVTFYRNSSFRTDITTAKALDYIEVQNRAGQVIKTVNFYTSTTTSGDFVSADPGLNKRMYLDSVAFSGTGLSKVEVYKFDYYNRWALPNRISDDQDHWGYYNAAGNGKALIPTCFPAKPGGGYLSVLGANRNPDSSVARCGTLIRMTYPTGGYAEYEYEGNQAANFSSVAEVGYDIRDSAFSYTIIGDPLGLTTTYSYNFTLDQPFGRPGICPGSIKLMGIPNTNVTPLPPAGIDDPVIMLTMPDNSTIRLRFDRTMVLPTGNYSITADFSANPDPDIISNFRIFIDAEEGMRFNTAKNTHIPVGGLRIRKTRLVDPVGNTQIEKRYKYEWEDGSSTGILGSFPVYTGLYNEAPCMLTPLLPYLTVSTLSQSTSMMMQGSVTGYSKVEEYLGADGENGKNIYYFSMLPDKASGGPFPFPPANSMDEFRGILIKQESYKKENSQYVKVSEKANNYNFISQNGYLIGDSLTVTARGLHFGQNTFDLCPTPGPADQFSWESAFYDTQTGWLKLLSDTARSFYPNATMSEVVTTYQYSDKSLLQSKKTTRNSDGKYQSVTFTYPSDYSIPGGAAGNRARGILALQQQHRLGQPTEVVQSVSDDGIQEKVTGGLFTSFKESNALPDTAFSLETTTPLTSFSGSTYAGDNIAIDNRYVARVLFNHYTESGNIDEQQKANDAPQSFIWDYSGQFPIAQVTGSTIDRVAYTSFEADGWGGWTMNPGSVIFDNGDPLTGRKVFSGVILKTVPLGNYTVGVWGTADTWVNGQLLTTPLMLKGAWKYFEVKLNNVSSIEVAANTMDEVRLYPQGAQMTTFTYDPLIGVTSQADAKNNILYYEYDGFGRLKVIRDIDKNVVKTFDYQYQANTNQ